MIKVNMVLALLLLVAAAWIDVRKRKIPNQLLAVFFAGSLLCVERNVPMLLQAFLLLSGLLLGAVVSKGALGMGDVKLLGVLAFLTGWQKTSITFVCGLLFASPVCLWMLVQNRENRRRKLPLAPFFLAGYLAVLLAE